eukprot:250606-Rhodomonas_salina.1
MVTFEQKFSSFLQTAETRMTQHLSSMTTLLETKANLRLQQHSEALKAEFTGVFNAAQERTDEQFRQMKISQEELGANVRETESGISALTNLLANSIEQQNQLREMMMMTQQNMQTMQLQMTPSTPQT